MALLNKKRVISKIYVTQNNEKELRDFIVKNNIVINKNIIQIVSSEDITAKFHNKVVHQGLALLCSTLSFSNDIILLPQYQI